MPDPSSDPSIFDEPHMRGQAGSRFDCWKCGYNRGGLQPGSVCPECGAGEFRPGHGGPLETAVGLEGAERAEQSVWEEPAMAATAAPADAETYARWLTEQRARTTPAASWAATILFAAAAGPWAIVGTFCGSFSGAPDGSGAGELSVVGLLAIIVFGPVMEEVMKVAAATWGVERRPYLFTSRAQVALCCVAGGLIFAVIENILYLNVYIANPTPEVRFWRWTVCVFLHCGCSLIAGLGLMRIWCTTVTTGKRPDLSRGTAFLVTAIITHGMYNALAIALDLVGVI